MLVWASSLCGRNVIYACWWEYSEFLVVYGIECRRPTGFGLREEKGIMDGLWWVRRWYFVHNKWKSLGAWSGDSICYTHNLWIEGVSAEIGNAMTFHLIFNVKESQNSRLWITILGVVRRWFRTPSEFIKCTKIVSLWFGKIIFFILQILMAYSY